MFRPVFGAAGRILLRRFCSQAAAAGSRPRPAGVRLPHLHSRGYAGDAAASVGHHNDLPQRERKLGRMVLAALSAVGFGLWYKKKNEEWAERAARPSRVDWVEAGVVSPVVRNQKNCGSCWAFSVAASVEAVHYLKTLQSISLSVQELVDCNLKNGGCDGGNYPEAFTYIRENGLSTESSYPYKARRSKCKRNQRAAARIVGFRSISPTEDSLEKAVAKQPVIVTVQGTDDLVRYQGGIMDYRYDVRNNDWHAVLIVGYGTDSDGVKYWRIKNSWGKRWGEGGFGRIRRHVPDRRGVLGIFICEPVYPMLTT